MIEEYNTLRHAVDIIYGEDVTVPKYFGGKLERVLNCFSEAKRIAFENKIGLTPALQTKVTDDINYKHVLGILKDDKILLWFDHDKYEHFKANTEIDWEETEFVSIVDLNLSIQAKRVLFANNILWLRDLILIGVEGLYNLGGIGEKYYREIKPFLFRFLHKSTKYRRTNFEEKWLSAIEEEKPALLKMDLRETGMSITLANLLVRNRISDVETLLAQDRDYLCSIRGFGRYSFKEVIPLFEVCGVDFKVSTNGTEGKNHAGADLVDKQHLETVIEMINEYERNPEIPMAYKYGLVGTLLKQLKLIRKQAIVEEIPVLYDEESQRLAKMLIRRLFSAPEQYLDNYINKVIESKDAIREVLEGN